MKDPLLSPWEEDPEYAVADWQLEVASGDTRLGYIEWVVHQKEANEKREFMDYKSEDRC